MRVLIVDDELSKLLQRELERQACQAEYTASAADALSRLSETAGEPCEVVLLDLDMPKVNGLELLKEVTEAGLDLDVIVITADGDEDKVMEAIYLGAIDYLRKPISLGELRTALFRIQQKRAAQGRRALKHRVLVVDDEEDLTARMKQELEKEGYEVAMAYDGLAGLEYFKNNHVDAVIADIRMPGMDGLEMLDQCRAINPDFVYIVITGFGDHEKAIKSLRLGVFDYLRKPISLEELIGVVGKGVDLVALRRSLDARQRELEIESALKTRYAGKLEEDITERKRAEEALKQSYQRLERLLEQIVGVLIAAVEMRDPYTAGHQRRVALISCAVAKEMGLSDERIEGIRMAALVHDVGKIQVPAEILSKPAVLSEIEMNLIKCHPQFGYDALKAIEFPWPVARIVLEHHERLNSSGYPYRLAGVDIMLEARIIAVADVVEAMSSHRPYRPTRGIDAALAEIQQNRGTLYDPAVVDACVRLLTEKGFKLEP